MFCGPAASGRPCQRSFRPRALRTIISCCGIGMARWSAFTMRSTWPYASRRGARRAPQQRSLTAKAPKRRKKGGLDRCAGLRCGQEGHRPQAARSRRYARFAVECCRPSRQYPGSRRSGAGSRPTHASPVPVHRADLRRRRLSRTTSGKCCRQHRPLDRGNRQAQRNAQVRRLAEALDRGANVGMDQSQSPLGARLRALRQDCRRLHPPCNDPNHAPPLDHGNRLSLNHDFLDRL